MSVISNALSAMTGISKGDITQKMMQALGMDRQSAALMGAMTDLKSNNLVGFHQNLTEAMTGFESSGGQALGAALMGRAMMPGAHFVGLPGMAMMGNTSRIDLKNKSGGLLSALGGAAAGFALGGPFGALAGGVLGMFAKNTVSRCKAKSIEKRLNRDPMFRAQFEAQVGGRYIPDGRNDGKITIARAGFSPFLPGLSAGVFPGLVGNPLTGSVLSGMNKMMQNATGLIASQNYLGQSTLMGRTVTEGERRMRATARPDGELAKLPTPATFEDLVSAFMMDMIKDMQDEMKQKMSEYEKMKGSNNENQAGGAGKSGKSGKSGGLFGGILGGLGKVVGGIGGGLLGSIVSPFLGTAVGGGLGSALGGMLGGAGGGILDGALGMFGLGGGGGNTSAAAGAQNTATGDSKGQATDSDSRQLLFEKIKDLMQKMQQALQSLSNVLNTMHQGAMNAIRNIRA